MSDTIPAVAAVYDPNRSADGKFAKGNTISQGASHGISRRFQALRALWFDANSVEDMEQVKSELINLCKTCTVPDVKLRAIIYYLDRTLGKPTENVVMDVTSDGMATGNTLVNLSLSPEELAVASKLVGRLAGQDEDQVEMRGNIP